MFGELVDELDALTDAQITAELRSLELEQRALSARRAALTAVANRRYVYHDDGHRNIKSWLRSNLNLTGSSAHFQKTVSNLVACYPSVGDAMLEGRLGWDQTVDLARLHSNHRYRDHLPAFLETLLDYSVRFDYKDFKRCVERFKTGANPDGTHQDLDTAVKHRDAHVSVLGDELFIKADGGDPITAEEVTQIFNHYVDAEYQTDLATRREMYGNTAESFDLPRTSSQRRHDAMVNIFRAAAGQPAGPYESVANPVVNIVIDASRFEYICDNANLTGDRFTVDPALDHMSVDDILNGHCETNSGTPVAPRTVLQAAIRGHIRRVVTDSRGVVVNLGRKTRLFTGKARTAAQLLATSCSYPGCDHPVEWCQIDHITPWATGGATDQPNAQLLCGDHNRLKETNGTQTHTDIWGKRRTARPDSTLILPVGMPPPIFPVPPPTPDQIEREETKRFVLKTGFTTEIFKITRPHSPPDGQLAPTDDSKSAV